MGFAEFGVDKDYEREADLVRENDSLKKQLASEKAGAEILEIEGADALDKMAKLAELVLHCDLATEKGLRAKHYAQYCLNQRKDDPEAQPSRDSDNA